MNGPQLHRVRAVGLIRPATPDDAAAIAELLRALGYPASPARVLSWLGELGDADRVLVSDGGLIALHRIPRIAEGSPFVRITALIVSPERRREGLGRALLGAAEEIARGWGCELLEVSSALRPERDAAHRFYPAVGFERASEHSLHYWKRLRDDAAPTTEEDTRWP